MKVETQRMLSIGRFARLTGLTVKALRHYDELGLLRPARVDDWTGYRWYEPSQLREAVAVRRLRSLRIPLDEVAVLIRSDDSSLREALAVHRARLEGEVVETRHILAELDALIEGKEQLVTDVTLDLPLVDEPAGRYAVAGERVRVDDMTRYVPETIMRVREWLDARGVPCIDPPLAIFLGTDIDEWFGVEVGWPIADLDLDAADGIVLRELPRAAAVQHVHRGRYEDLPDVYRALEPAIRERGYEPLELPREHYVGHPNNRPAPDEYETRIIWPVRV
jgi:DNA-binding transcriptional MerR regulator/effector-binding domain-containing protein